MVASKSHKKQGEEQEKEKRQPHGPNRRERWHLKATTNREKSRRRKAASPMGQIGANAGKQKPQQAGRRAGERKAPAPWAK